MIEYGNFISGPFCTKILADLGAEVIKIEKPVKGDDARKYGPFPNDIPDSERSGLFLYLNMNKFGITLNLETKTGMEIFTELLKEADIVVENNRPDKMNKIGLTYERVKQIKPDIVLTSISPFGQTGPYRDYKSCELLNAHMGGTGYASTREVDISREPIKQPGYMLSFQAGLSAAAISIGSLYHCCITGNGSHIDVSEQESVIQNMALHIPQFCYGKHIVARTDRFYRAPFHILPCKDGYIYHAFVKEDQWQRFLEVMGNPDWADNELFKDYETRALYWDGLKPLLLEWTMQHTMDEIYRMCQDNSAPIGAVYTAEDILKYEHLSSRNFFTEIEHEATGTLKYPGTPYQYSDVSYDQPMPAPMLGQHNELILCNRLGYRKYDLVKMREAGII